LVERRPRGESKERRRSKTVNLDKINFNLDGSGNFKQKTGFQL